MLVGFFKPGTLTRLIEGDSKFKPVVKVFKMTLCHILFTVKSLGQYILYLIIFKDINNLDKKRKINYFNRTVNKDRNAIFSQHNFSF